jgi:Na+-translocating ferredoxin:NAD+ oxidoreductase RNF subunit RnfB
MAIIAFGIIGLVVGIILSIAAKVFEVKTDPKIDLVLECLPGANCGGCGFAGCGACAEAIVTGKANIDACPGISEENLNKISKIMGIESSGKVKKSAFVFCNGTCDVSFKKYDFDGTKSCYEVNALNNGDKLCNFSCLGYGDCVNACKFGALSIEDGIAKVDKSKCTGCGVCVNTCPRNVISLLPSDTKYYVKCQSKDKGTVMKAKCTAGCIGCGICAKNCVVEAIEIVDNCAKINIDKCIGCGACLEKCPKKIIFLN